MKPRYRYTARKVRRATGRRMDAYLVCEINECLNTDRHEQALWLAVIREAWADANSITSRAHRRDQDEGDAHNFLSSQSSGWKMSRELVCECADIDVSWIERQYRERANESLPIRSDGQRESSEQARAQLTTEGTPVGEGHSQ